MTDSNSTIEFDVPMRRKLTLTLPAVDVPLIEPPRKCGVCREERPGHSYLGRTTICVHCIRALPRAHRSLPWECTVAWSDRVQFDEAANAVRLLEQEIAHAKR